MFATTHFRRLLRLRLGTLLILVTVCCVAMATLQSYRTSFQRQRAAIEKLRKVHAVFTWQSASPRWLAPLIGRENYRDVIFVDLSLCEVQNGDLAALSNLPRLKQLILSNNPIDGEGLCHIAGLKHLEKLSLANTDVGDAELKYLAQLKRLERLDLGNTRITDEGLKAVATLKQLKELRLGPQITDAGLDHIVKLTDLRSLNLYETATTFQGVARLRNPKLESLRLPKWQERIGREDLIHFRHLSGLRRLPGPIVNCEDSDLLRLRQHPHLSFVSIRSPHITDAAIDHLAELKELRGLQIAGAITPAGILKLSSSRIETATVNSTAIDSTNVRQLKYYRGATRVLASTKWMTAEEIAAIKSTLPPLLSLGTDFSFDGTSAEIRSGGIVNDWSRLLNRPIRELYIDWEDEACSPIRVIEQMADLKQMYCRTDHMTVEEFRRIVALPDIQASVHLRNVDPVMRQMINDAAIAVLRNEDAGYRIQSLQRLHEFRDSWPPPAADEIQLFSPTSEELAAAIGASSKIRSLVINSADRRLDLSALSAANQLHQLRIVDSHFDARQFAAICAAKQLANLMLQDSQLVGGNFQQIQRLENLVALTIAGVPVSAEDLLSLGELKKLRLLRLGETGAGQRGPQVTDDVITALGKLPVLESLTIEDQLIHGRAFGQWNRAHPLMSLRLAGCSVTDEGVREIVVLEQLQRLDVSYSRVTPASMKALKRARSLRELNVLGCQFTYEDAEQLKRNLEYLERVDR